MACHLYPSVLTATIRHGGASLIVLMCQEFAPTAFATVQLLISPTLGFPLKSVGR